MKTIQFTGAEHKIENLHLALGISDNDMPQQSETRVYVMPILLDYSEEDLEGISDEEFMDLAEEDGRVYTLQGFQEAFALNEVTPFVDVIRFINQPIY
jgi:hypothetical protein